MYRFIKIIIITLFSIALTHDCIEMDPFDYGDCEMEIGWGWTGDECSLISGCSTINSDGIDNAEFFFSTYALCIDECIIHNGNHGDLNEDSLIDVLDIVILINIILDIIVPNEQQSWSADMNFDDIIDILDIIMTIDIILGGEYTGLSTWEIIQEEIFNESCISCHVEGNFYAEQSSLILTEDLAYEELINIIPTNSSAEEDGMVIISNDGGLLGLQKSYLWEKIDIWDQEHYYADHPNYGALMPMGGPYLTQGELDFIKQWIFAGSPDFGTVADVVLLNNMTEWSQPEFIPLDPPENGIQIHLDIFDIWTNNEREIFYYTPLDTIDDIYIKKIEISMRSGSHHFILYTYDQNTPPFAIPEPYVIRDLHNEDGDYNNEIFINMAFQNFVAGTQLPYSNYSMPEGIALKLPSDFGFDINSHYINPTDSIYHGEVYANLHLVDPSELEHVAHIFSLSNDDIILPPGEETTIEASFMYPVGFGMDLETDSIFVFQLFSHAHELMTRFDVEFIGGELDGELLYTALDWEHPPIFELDPPLIITIGHGLRLRTTYYNWRDEEVNFGFFSTDEMMILFGHCYGQ